MTNYYDILGISPDATADEIHEAFTFQVKVFHPDKYNPVKQPKQYARALKMTSRLNDARDTLLDPAKRSAHDAHLRDEPTPAPAPLAAINPTHKRWLVLGTMGALFLISAVSVINKLDFTPKPSVAEAVTSPTPPPCPIGEPGISVTKVDIRPNPNASPYDRLPSRLYIITGIIENHTSSPIYTDEVGFYLGTRDPDLPPAWENGLRMMETTGQPAAIPAGGSITWKEKHVVEHPEPFPANVIPTLTYPYNVEVSSEPHWYWTEADSDCEPVVAGS
ncbi:MAG: hypothetical protein K0S68_354 [Candidatus Saccharibacteria bacterium]|nr:hypothetical protein [Candidatus Saccharibacteria bacterium]